MISWDPSPIYYSLYCQGSMAEPKRQTPPAIVVLGPPDVFRLYNQQFAAKFRLLKPWESSLPLSHFLAANAQNTEVALCAGWFSLSADILRALPSLRLVITSSAGIDHIDLVECRRRDIAVASAGTIFSADVADLAVGLLIDVLRNVSASNRFVKNGFLSKQDDYPLGFKLGGKKVGIVGLGSIGLEVAKRLEAFGCVISYHSKKRKSCLRYIFHSHILELAAASDILILCCSLNEETRHMINREVLLTLGKKGVIVNIARGSVIDEKELLRCLQQNEIAGAGLDVFENEPCVPKEFFDLDNVVLSPHVAVFTHESFTDIYELVSANMEAYFSNKPLISSVSLE